jgi:hypothetical protein
LFKAQALRLFNRQYRTVLDPNRKKGKTADRQHEKKMKELNDKNFPPKKVKENATRNEGDSGFFQFKRLMYCPETLKPGEKRIGMDVRKRDGKIVHPARRPIARQSFSGMFDRGIAETRDRIEDNISPAWVRYHFNSVWVEFIMLSPNIWFDVPVGNSRLAEDKAPERLLVRKVLIKYQQFDRDWCLPMGVASCLDYCGEKEPARQFSLKASHFENLNRDIGIKTLKEKMRNFVPCIGDCTIFNSRTAKKRATKKLLIEDLIMTKTRFPTVIFPVANDGSANHAVVVIDDLIFDSTQAYALKLCRESLDWICGDMGIASINVCLRFNRGYGTKDKLQHKDTVNW